MARLRDVRSRSIPLVGVVVLLGVVVVAAGLGTAWTTDPVDFDLPMTEVSMPAMSAPPPASPVPPVEPGPTPAWLVPVVVTVAVLLVVLALLGLVRFLWGRRPEGRDEAVAVDSIDVGVATGTNAVDVPVLVDAVEAALARLDDAATPTDAVVAAWVSLEEAAAEHGWERHPSETSTEFTSRLLDVSPAPPAQTAVLRGLYQQARFTSHPVTPAQVGRARTALETIARALEGRSA